MNKNQQNLIKIEKYNFSTLQTLINENKAIIFTAQKNFSNKFSYRLFSKIKRNINILKPMLHLYDQRIITNKHIYEKIYFSLLTLKQFNLKENIVKKLTAYLQILHNILSLIASSFKSYKRKAYRCVAPHCNEVAISSHTISKSNNFTKGVIYYSIQELKVHSTTVYKPRHVSQKKASTYPIFCSKHDRDIFIPIENGKNINPYIKEHLFLQNWRTFTMHHLLSKEKKHEFMADLDRYPNKALNINYINIPDYMSSYDGSIYRHEQPESQILYLNLELEKSPSILASSIIDARYLNRSFITNKSSSTPEYNFIYIHILPNGEHPLVNISAFDNDINKKALLHLEGLYHQNKEMFLNTILALISTSNNLFINDDLFVNNNLMKKFLKIYISNRSGSKNLYNIPNFDKKVKPLLNQKDFDNIFGPMKLVTNLHHTLIHTIKTI